MTNKEVSNLGKYIASKLQEKNPLVKELAKRFDLRMDLQYIRDNYEEPNNRRRTRRS